MLSWLSRNLNNYRYKLSMSFYKISELICSDKYVYCKSCDSCGEPGCCPTRCSYFNFYLDDHIEDLKYIRTQLLSKNLETALEQLNEIISRHTK